MRDVNLVKDFVEDLMLIFRSVKVAWTTPKSFSEIRVENSDTFVSLFD